MMPPVIIDRRRSPTNNSSSNRQRFIDRYKSKIRDSLKKSLNSRSIKDTSDQEVSLPVDDLSEPHFSHKKSEGTWEGVLPGNKEYQVGDKIDKPKNGRQSSRGKEGSSDTEIGSDEFSFVISYNEYLSLIFDDLELPDLDKLSQGILENFQNKRAGYSVTGAPTNLNIEKTAIAGLSRRLALKTPKSKEIAELRVMLATIDDTDENQQEKLEITQQIQQLTKRKNAIAYLDTVDLRYNNFVKIPKPITKAVMFCILDVSYSMGEREKTIAKKFFLLLYLFINRKYKNTEVVFIRHHTEASECNEEDFFTSKVNGGTIVSSSYKLMNEIIADRYNPNEYNIYISQVSDGDNSSSDFESVGALLTDTLMLSQFMAYLEISQPVENLFLYETSLWEALSSLSDSVSKKLLMQKIYHEKDIIQTFRNFFTKG